MTGPTGEIVVVSGRYRGHRIPLAKEIVRIGRDRSCELPLDDESASRVHSEIIRRGTGFFVRDLGSTNGTYLNDTRITESELQNGDRVAIGDTVLLIQLQQKETKTVPQIVFSKEQKRTSTRFSLSLNDTRFLELQAGTSIPDAQRQFTSLYEFMVDVAGILHPPALLERALVHFFKAFTADRALVLLLSPDGQPGMKTTRIRDGLEGIQNIMISRTMVHQLLEKKESFLSLNASSDLRLSASESLHNMRVFSVMGAPLKVKDKVIGMIYLDTIAGGKPFSEQDLKLCTAMTIQLAVCIENTRLYTELLDAAEFNNSVLRSLGSGIVVVDSAGRVLRINRATQEILHKDESSLLGHSLSEFPELSELNRIIQNTLISGRPEDRYEVLVRADTEVVPLGLSTSALSNHTGKIIGVVANFRNLAHIRKLEEQVRRSQHLAALGQMAAGVAHEIRNPLNAIRGFAQLLHESPAVKDSKQAEYTQIIFEEVDRMNRIVQDLLDFSRQRELTLLPLQLNKLLDELVREMQGDAQQARVKLEVICPEQPLPNVLGNHDKLRQVFRNVILNALQACKSEGLVRIRFAVVDDVIDGTAFMNLTNKGEGAPRREVVVSIEDSGCGIDAAVISKIFDPFFTQKEKGTGLGLSISQKIIDQHSGRIDVKSQLTKGSIFSVMLPAL